MPKLTAEQNEQYYRVRLDPWKLHHAKGMEHRSMCPFHGGSNSSALLVHLDEGHFFCFACQAKGPGVYAFEQKMQERNLGHVPEHNLVQRAIEEIIGTPFVQRTYIQPLERTAKGWDRKQARDFYRYTDELGKEIFTVWRFVDRDGKKLTPPDHPCACQSNTDAECEPGCDSGRVWGSKGLRRVLYRLHDVLQASLVFVVEGERNVNDLSRALAAYIAKRKGFPFQTLTLDRVAVTTNAGGATAWKREYGYGKYFQSRIVVKLGDNDGPGRIHDRDACTDIAPYALKLLTLELPVGDGEDISDYLAKNSIEDFLKLLPSCKEWELPKTTHPTISDALEPRRLLVKPSELVAPGNEGGDWLVPGLIQRGTRGLIVAKPKTGKSFLFLDIAISLATQGKVLSLPYYHRPVKVGIISREDGPQLVSERLKMLAVGRNLTMNQIDKNIRINTEAQSSSFRIDKQSDLEEMADWLRMEGIEFCVIDVLVRLHLGKENSADDMGKIMLKFDELARLSGSQVCVIHHSNSEGEGRGSSAIDGWADYIFRLESDPEDQAIKKLSVRTKASGAVMPRMIRYMQSDDMKESRIELLK